MADIFSKHKRSEVMSKVRSRGNKATELAMMKLFRQNHVTGWRRNQDVFGRPDFLFRRSRLVLFVDGCFWHGCPRCYRRPKSNRKLWDAKIARNRERDCQVSRELRRLGWLVVRVWEHSLAKKGNALKRIQTALNSSRARSRKDNSE
jgi:DNA mismatch endonuclease (patch repair protein)